MTDVGIHKLSNSQKIEAPITIYVASRPARIKNLSCYYFFSYHKPQYQFRQHKTELIQSSLTN